MVFKSKAENLAAQHKYLGDPENRAKHQERCLAYYYKNKEKLYANKHTSLKRGLKTNIIP